MQMPGKLIFALATTLHALIFVAKGASPLQARPSIQESAIWVTNVAQFRSLAPADFLAGCDFHLRGVVTLVDTNRNLFVLQDATGAAAFSYPIAGKDLFIGHEVTLAGTNCCPLNASFPSYPYHPSGGDIQSAFEAPTNWGEYHLTQMSGLLTPPVSGNYRFWIASDNSSELWLSTDASPSKIRRIAAVPRFGYTDPRQWSRFPSQESEPILLKAGQPYYIEALQEQTAQAENLAVAWRVPATNASPINIIDGQYLTPWPGEAVKMSSLTHGILREYWTNYTSADLTGLAGTRPYESALSVRQMTITDHGTGQMPEPTFIILSQPMSPENNYRWVRAEGLVKFKAVDANGCVLEITDGSTRTTVHVVDANPVAMAGLSNIAVQVTGVCEAISDRNDQLVPGLIWVTTEGAVCRLANATNVIGKVTLKSTDSMATNTSSTMQGFYGTSGVVTFADRLFNQDYIFIQENSAVMRVDIANRPFTSQLKTGCRVNLGGLLQPDKTPPVITPVYVAPLGRQALPKPVSQPLALSGTANLDGKWSELEGVVHSVNARRALSITTKDGTAHLWLGQTPTNQLSRYVDAKVCARGVFISKLGDAPALLIPSRDFLEVLEEPPAAPFKIARTQIAAILKGDSGSPWEHRVRVAGEITYRNEHSFFIQDSSGGIRVQTTGQPAAQVGDSLELVAFPRIAGAERTLTDPVMRPGLPPGKIYPQKLDLSDVLASSQKGLLVAVRATLLSQKANGNEQTLQLQQSQHVFEAVLSARQGKLPKLIAGSQLRLTGVCDDGMSTVLNAGEKNAGRQFLPALKILLRAPEDVKLLSGPPWWTWKKAATLVAMLLTILAVALSWVHLLQQRLKRQKAAQLAFSRHVFGKLEEERSRIASNLHDSLGQMLLVIKNHTLVASQLPAEDDGLRGRLDEISGTTTQAIEEVRRITRDLRPYQLDRLGLTQAMRTLVDKASKNKAISFASRVEDIDNTFDKDAEIHVYRIVQESISNVVRHSAATEAAVVVKKRPTTVLFSIRDNGCGFDPARPDAQSRELGYGLTGIAERVRILSGTLLIESKPGSGTSLSVEVPFRTG